MKTLYVSDLDGTLLRSDERTSEYTNQKLNELTQKGMLFSYATARSLITARKATVGLDAKIPLIVYNGSFIVDNATGELLLSNFFEEDIKETLRDLLEHDIYPLVYSYKNSVEQFSFIPSKCSRGLADFLNSRKGDPRTHIVSSEEELFDGNIFYMTCIDEEEKLKPFYEKYKEKYHCIFARDIYSNEQWLEFLPLTASKANAILQLKEYLGCDRVVAFGDGKNDISMFEIADECYAVENAAPELKALATGIIGSNNEDSVVKWLETTFLEHEKGSYR